MAMNYAWQERKKFMVPVVTGAVVLFIWYVFILGGINAAADRDLQARKTAEGFLRLKMQAGVPTDDSVARADRDKGVFQKDLKEIQDKLVFRVDEGFKAKEGQSAATKFGSQRQAVFQKIEQVRIPKGLDQVDAGRLGFPQSVMGMTEPVLAEWLVRLAVVQRACLYAMDCGVVSFKLVEVVPSDSQDEPTVPPGRFMGILPIKFKVTGKAEAILKLVHGLQQEGPNYLALEGLEVTSADPTQNLLGAVVTAGALVVRPEAELTVEAKQ